MSLQFNPLEGIFDLVNVGGVSASNFKNTVVSYLDEGLKSQRIDKVTMTSIDTPSCEILIDVFWLSVGTINQRIEKLEMSGSAFSSSMIRKVFEYIEVDGKYFLKGYNYERF